MSLRWAPVFRSPWSPFVVRLRSLEKRPSDWLLLKPLVPSSWETAARVKCNDLLPVIVYTKKKVMSLNRSNQNQWLIRNPWGLERLLERNLSVHLPKNDMARAKRQWIPLKVLISREQKLQESETTHGKSSKAWKASGILNKRISTSSVFCFRT